MRNEEFFGKLRAWLSQTMSQQEVTAQIRYYENYIQEQIQNGRSEEEVLTELGDPLLIAKHWWTYRRRRKSTAIRRPMFMRNGADRRVAMHRENCIVWK